ncbi:MAG: DUF1292 domain-containing protein [Lachnospiraceae bacterium]|nr:DUF1292 domain-containing protein [Lachnospiraceae bacterium]
MSDNDKFISFTSDDGEELFFNIIESTTIMGREYILVTEREDEDTVYLMRRDSEDSASDEVSYSFVEDESELDSVSKVFQELLEDADIISED